MRTDSKEPWRRTAARITRIACALRHCGSNALKTGVPEDDIEAISARVQEQISPFEQAVTLLRTIPGVERRTAEVIIAETGGDMSVFPTAKHLASWAGVCPGQNESAGKRKSAKTRSIDLAG